jgi:hypothetical protein
MNKLMLVVGLAAFAVPAASNAQWAVRAGLETPIYTHFSQNGQSGSYTIGDTFQPAINVLVEYYPVGLIGLGLEFREGFAASGTGYSRTGTFLGPNLTLDFPLGLFARAAIPIHIEPDPPGVTMNLRLAGGLKLLAFLYLEATADFPMAGSNVSFFGQQQFGIAAGAWFKF